MAYRLTNPKNLSNLTLESIRHRIREFGCSAAWSRWRNLQREAHRGDEHSHRTDHSCTRHTFLNFYAILNDGHCEPKPQGSAVPQQTHIPSATIPSAEAGLPRDAGAFVEGLNFGTRFRISSPRVLLGIGHRVILSTPDRTFLTKDR
jgi:hypothetical protein